MVIKNKQYQTIGISFFNRNDVLISFSFVIPILYFLFFHIVFEQNDDIWLRFLSNAYFTGNHEVYLVYMNNLLGYLLRFFYTTFPAFEWYSLLLIFSLLLSYLSNLFCIIKFSQQNIKFFLIGLNFVVIYFLSRLQFSYCAGFLTVSAVICQFYFLKTLRNHLLVISAFLMLLASLIRFEMFVFTYFPFAIIYIFSFRNFKKFKIIYISLILIMGAKCYHNYQYYKNENWKAYYTFNKYRQSAVANININFKNSEFLSKIGITEKDAILLQNFVFTPSLTSDKLSLLTSYSNNTTSFITIIHFLFDYTQPYFITLTIFLFISLLIKDYRLSSLIVLHFFICIFTVKYQNNVQYRILYPTLYGILFFFIPSFMKNTNSFKVVGLSISFLILYYFALIDIKKTNFFNIRTENSIKLIENQLPKNRILLINPKSNYFIFSRLAFSKPRIKTVFFGWLTNYPSFIKILPNYNSNLFEMTDYPLLIDINNYKTYKNYIKNTEIYIINDSKLNHIKQ